MSRRKGVKKIRQAEVYPGVFARFAEGESRPRSYQKYLSKNEVSVLKHLKSQGFEPVKFRLVKGKLYLKPAGKAVCNRNLSLRQDLSLKDRQEIARQAAKQLGKTHALGVHQRDIKTSHVLWDERKKKATIIDFTGSEKVKINWQKTSVKKIIYSFGVDLYWYPYFLLWLKVPKPKQYLTLLVDRYPVSKKKKQAIIKELVEKYLK